MPILNISNIISFRCDMPITSPGDINILMPKNKTAKVRATLIVNFKLSCILVKIF